jgi:hypothetical protein
VDGDVARMEKRNNTEFGREPRKDTDILEDLGLVGRILKKGGKKVRPFSSPDSGK